MNIHISHGNYFWNSFQTIAWKYYRVNYKLAAIFWIVSYQLQVLKPFKNYFTFYLHKSFPVKSSTISTTAKTSFSLFSRVSSEKIPGIYTTVSLFLAEIFLFQCNEFFFLFLPFLCFRRCHLFPLAAPLAAGGSISPGCGASPT